MFGRRIVTRSELTGRCLGGLRLLLRSPPQQVSLLEAMARKCNPKPPGGPFHSSRVLLTHTTIPTSSVPSSGTSGPEASESADDVQATSTDSTKVGVSGSPGVQLDALLQDTLRESPWITNASKKTRSQKQDASTKMRRWSENYLKYLKQRLGTGPNRDLPRMEDMNTAAQYEFVMQLARLHSTKRSWYPALGDPDLLSSADSTEESLVSQLGEFATMIPLNTFEVNRMDELRSRRHLAGSLMSGNDKLEYDHYCLRQQKFEWLRTVYNEARGKKGGSKAGTSKMSKKELKRSKYLAQTIHSVLKSITRRVKSGEPIPSKALQHVRTTLLATLGQYTEAEVRAAVPHLPPDVTAFLRPSVDEGEAPEKNDDDVGTDDPRCGTNTTTTLTVPLLSPQETSAFSELLVLEGDELLTDDGRKQLQGFTGTANFHLLREEIFNYCQKEGNTEG